MSLIDDAKSLAGLAKRVSELELRNEFNAKIAEVTGGLLEIQQRVIELQEENVRLREQARENEKTEDLLYDRGVFWPAEPDHTNGPAYCPACVAKDSLRVPLSAEKGYGRGYCSVCKEYFTDVFNFDLADRPEPFFLPDDSRLA